MFLLSCIAIQISAKHEYIIHSSISKLEKPNNFTRCQPPCSNLVYVVEIISLHFSKIMSYF